MADALATLFEDACPRPQRFDVESDRWRLHLDDGPALRVVVAVDGVVGAGSGGVRVEAPPGAVLLSTGGGGLDLDVGAPRPRWVLVGSYDLGGSVCDRVLTGLPALLVGSAHPSLVDLLAEEAAAARAGRDAVVLRVLDLLAVSALRDWMEAHPDVSPAWATAHRDPVVGRALELIHENPGAAWTVASLARKAGSSRSALSRRFTETVGEAPMSYLVCWRMCLAADLLAKTDLPLASVAARVGYSSPYAFSTAFHRYRGVRPGAHRRSAG